MDLGPPRRCPIANSRHSEEDGLATKVTKERQAALFHVGLALIGVVTFGSLAGSMLPFVLRGLGFDPASASAPFVAYAVLRGTLP